jgi:hypothetical protein
MLGSIVFSVQNTLLKPLASPKRIPTIEESNRKALQAFVDNAAAIIAQQEREKAARLK